MNGLGQQVSPQVFDSVEQSLLIGSTGEGNSQFSVSDLQSAGIDQGVAQALLNSSATDAQIQAAMNDPDAQDAAIVLLEKVSSTPGIATNNTPTGAVPSGAPAIPVGSQLTYTATYTAGLTTWSLDSAISKVNSWLSANPVYGNALRIVGSGGNSNLLTAPTMILVVQVVGGGGFARAVDVQGILDQAVRDTQSGLQSSSIAIGTAPSASGAGIIAESMGTWLGNNWYWVLLVGGGAGLAYTYLKRL